MRDTFLNWRAKIKRYEPAIFFTAGFLFDVFTLRRIDDWLKLGFQILFLLLLGVFLIYQYRAVKPGWQVSGLLKRIWPYQIEIVHFLFGSLLSAYAIFYFKSASATRSVSFLIFIAILMVLNEFEFIRRQGVELRTFLYAFCMSSFCIYFFPVVRGSMSDGLFLFSMAMATALTSFLIFKMIKDDEEEKKKKSLLKLGLPSLAINLLLVASYFLKIIPPVPLSMAFGGIYHKVDKLNGRFELYSLKPWYNFWDHGDRHFLSRDGDPLFCFVRIFAPAKFSHNVFLRWQLYNPRSGKYIDQDRIGMPIAGGREEGFRGYAFKSHYQPGRWRVIIETEDARPIGEIPFSVEQDTDSGPRVWMIEEG